jgi:hypothetical protein
VWFLKYYSWISPTVSEEKTGDIDKASALLKNSFTNTNQMLGKLLDKDDNEQNCPDGKVAPCAGELHRAIWASSPWSAPAQTCASGCRAKFNSITEAEIGQVTSENPLLVQKSAENNPSKA